MGRSAPGSAATAGPHCLPSALPPAHLQLGAGVDPEWLAQHTARTSGSGGSDLSGSDLGSDEYSPRSSDASPSARRWAGRAWDACLWVSHVRWSKQSRVRQADPRLSLHPCPPCRAASNGAAAGASPCDRPSSFSAPG